MQTKHLCVLIHIWTKGEVGAPLNQFKPSSKTFIFGGGGGGVSGRLLDSRPRVRASPASLRCGPWARHIYPSLVLVQPKKTRPCLTERLLMGLKNQIKQNKVKHFTDASKVVLLLWIFFAFSVLFLLRLCSVCLMCLVVTCWERADVLFLVCGVLLWVSYFPIGILGQVWYLILLIPDLCTLTYFDPGIHLISFISIVPLPALKSLV